MICIFNPSTREVKAGGLYIVALPGLNNMILFQGAEEIYSERKRVRK